MLIRGYARCETCRERYILRTGVGTEKYQLHSFDCKTCGLPLSLVVRADPPTAHYEAKENIIFEDVRDDNQTVINLHPFYAFSSDEIHDPTVFVSLSYGRKIMPHCRIIPDQKFMGFEFQDISRQFSVPNAVNLWATVKSIFLLEDGSGQEKRIETAIDHYEKQRQKYFVETQVSSSREVAENFFDSLFYPRFEKILEPALTLVYSIKDNYSDKFQQLLNFYLNELKHEHLRQYLLIFSDYFNVYNQLSQIVVHSKLGDENVDNKIVGSKSFETVKLYYGQAYESITSFFVTFACLNNILLGRSYDQFQEMSLNKYLKDVSKEKRANPFSQTEQFYVFTDGLDSTLRNGSHHASIWRNGEKIFYRSGGTGAQREITYSRYLHLCNKLTISLAALFVIELELKRI